MKHLSSSRTSSLHQRGFTLIEILIVMAIIALLAVVLFPSLITYLARGRDSTRTVDIQSISRALGTYANENGGNYPASDNGCIPSVLAPNYLPVVPKSPSGSSYDEGCGKNGRYGYAVSGMNYILMANMETTYGGNYSGSTIGFTGTATDTSLSNSLNTQRGNGSIYIASVYNGNVSNIPASIPSDPNPSDPGNNPYVPPPAPSATWDIIFDSAGGTGSTPSIGSVVKGAPLAYLPTNPSKEGYTFNGWYTMVGTGGTQITPATVPTSGATYFAQWTVIPVGTLSCSGTGNPSTPTLCSSAPDITLLNGQVWKACNLGATYVCEAGSLYQWGRNVAFPNTGTVDTIAGPLSFSTEATVSNKFITVNGNWLTPRNLNLLGGGASTPSSGTYNTVGSTNQGLMQGACPPTYHIPTIKEWCDAIDSIYGTTLGCQTGLPFNSLSMALRLPLSTSIRSELNGATINNYGYYWSSSPSSVPYGPYVGVLYLDSTNVGLNNANQASGLAIRCLKNPTMASIPSTYNITFDSAGASPTSSTLIITQGSALSTLPTSPVKTGYTFLGWFTANSGGTRITSATIPSADTTYYAQWEVLATELPLYCTTNTTSTIPCSTAPDITLLNGQVWKACNLGATYVCEAGSLYQWGRNVAFPNTGTVQTTPGPLSIPVSLGTDKFIAGPNDWLSPGDSNLLGGNTTPFTAGTYDTVSYANQARMQGACPSGYHIPTMKEWCNAIDSIYGTTGCQQSISPLSFSMKLSLPLVTSIRDQNSTIQETTSARYWTSSPQWDWSKTINLNASTFSVGDTYRIWSVAIRCMKNPLVPLHTAVVTFEPNIPGVSTSLGNNLSFEYLTYGGGYYYWNSMSAADRIALGWTGVGNAVLLQGNTAFGFVPAPDGTQSIGLQTVASIEQSISFASTGSYQITWYDAARPSSGGEPYDVMVDGVVITSIDASAISTSTYNQRSASFTISTAGSHTIKFITKIAADLTTSIDKISILQGVGTPTTQKTIQTDGSVSIGTFPADPVQPGYTFLGWFTDQTGGTQVYESNLVIDTVTYYAHWLPF